MVDKIFEESIETIDEFHKKFKDYEYNKTIFRGVKDEKYDLKPRVGRIKFDRYDLKKRKLKYIENDILRLFIERAIPFLSYIPENKWEWLVTAQHYRLPTRLLDWSRNPLVAAYFAVDKKFSGNSAIYVYKAARVITTDRKKYPNPIINSGIKDVIKLIPKHINPRITAQSGLFTYHPNPDKPFINTNKKLLEKIIIINKNDFRRKLKKMLYHYGTHEASIFPGLESAAHHIEWMKRKVHSIDE